MNNISLIKVVIMHRPISPNYANGLALYGYKHEHIISVKAKATADGRYGIILALRDGFDLDTIQPFFKKDKVLRFKELNIPFEVLQESEGYTKIIRILPAYSFHSQLGRLAIMERFRLLVESDINLTNWKQKLREFYALPSQYIKRLPIA